MTALAHPYSFTSGTSIASAEVNANFAATRTTVNGNLDGDNLTATVAGQLGLSRTGVVSRGKLITATEETTASAAYTTLTTPDQVSSVVLPTDGLIYVVFEALFKQNTTTIGSKAAIFLGANQLKAQAITAPAVQETSLGAAIPVANNYAPAYTTSAGLASITPGATTYGSSVTTGQVVGSSAQAAVIHAAAGTYTVSIKWLAAAATTLSVKERKLWVVAMGF